MAGQTHSADARILNERTLAKNHRRLAEVLRPGASVLDIGCGTGAITAGIARVAGRVLGVDRDRVLIEQARNSNKEPNLSFLEADVTRLDIGERFDFVTAARVLQWVGNPGAAIRRMAATTVPGGMVVVLDYNHEDNRLAPEPPLEFALFYRSFLDWRAGHGWDNRMGDNLPGLFEAAGLSGICSTVEDEVTATSIWPHVIESLGPQMVLEGALSDQERQAALAAMNAFSAADLSEQTLVLRAVTGVR